MTCRLRQNKMDDLLLRLGPVSPPINANADNEEINVAL